MGSLAAASMESTRNGTSRNGLFVNLSDSLTHTGVEASFFFGRLIATDECLWLREGDSVPDLCVCAFMLAVGSFDASRSKPPVNGFGRTWKVGLQLKGVFVEASDHVLSDTSLARLLVAGPEKPLLLYDLSETGKI